LAVFAVPLVASGVAQAALAGAIPSNMTSRPDLRSATINPIYNNIVEVCFDKTLNSIVSAPSFALGGYRSTNLLTASSVTIDQTNTNCAIATFPAATVDENQYTFLELTGGAVISNSNPSPSGVNLPDSVALTGSTSHSGTTGVTTTPNLVGVLAPDGVNLSTQTLYFVFDKTTHVTSGTGFFYETSAGGLCHSSGFAASTQDTTTIAVEFAGGAGCGIDSVGQAVRAGVTKGTTYADYDPVTAGGNHSGGGGTNPNETTVLPNCTAPCATSKPDLVSAALGSNQDQMTFTFDHNVIVTSTTKFYAELANGDVITSTGAVGTGGTTVTATFGGNLSVNAEFAVLGYVDAGAVADADNATNANLPGSANVGDNAGAFGSGFTTAPDVFGVTIDGTAGTITVNLDDRVNVVHTADILLFTGQGSLVTTAAPTASFNSSAGPGPTTVTLLYPPSSLTNVTNVYFANDAFGRPGSAPETHGRASTRSSIRPTRRRS
jgi:hypothetical protein